MFTHEHISKQGTLAHEHVSMQDRLACEHVCMQGMLEHEPSKHARHIGT